MGNQTHQATAVAVVADEILTQLSECGLGDAVSAYITKKCTRIKEVPASWAKSMANEVRNTLLSSNSAKAKALAVALARAIKADDAAYQSAAPRAQTGPLPIAPMPAVEQNMAAVDVSPGDVRPITPTPAAGVPAGHLVDAEASAPAAEGAGAQDGRDGHAFMLAIDKIKFDPELKALFPPDKSVLARVEQRVNTEGYDEATPVVVDEDNTLVDGHTRVEGSTRAGLKEVLAIRKTFRDTHARLEYAIQAQFARRNLDDANMVRLIRLVDRPAQHGGARKKKGDKTEAVASRPR